MKFKVTEVSTTYIKVEYDDGNWTLIPTKTGWKKEDYLRQIGARAPVATVEVSLNDNPIKLGDEGTVGEGYEQENVPEVEPKYSWKYVRMACYPDSQVQHEAWLDHYNGDSAKLELVKKHCAMVKELVPVEENQDEHWTWEQLEAKQKEVEADSRSYGNGEYA